MSMFRWTRQSTQSQEELWHLRLADMDPEHVVMLTRPGSAALMIHVFGDEKTMARLKKIYGGKITRLSKEVWTGDPQQPRAPISIRGMLRIHADAESFSKDPRPKGAIFLPPGMAFGTGDHATTASCLRFLCDILPTLPNGWRALDAGTGSGLLAIAAKKLGAAEVDAFDFDPVCIRVAKQNVRANKCRDVFLTVADTLNVRDFKKADVVFANLYSELLIAAAPGLVKKLNPGGRLIFSGVLKTQINEVLAALRKLGLKRQQIVNRGKWCAGIASF
ncbi:MAG: 50S ribosomal protein L11 methyltransferase [Verrucomicrobiota bacterium]